MLSLWPFVNFLAGQCEQQLWYCMRAKIKCEPPSIVNIKIFLLLYTSLTFSYPNSVLFYLSFLSSVFCYYICVVVLLCKLNDHIKTCCQASEVLFGIPVVQSPPPLPHPPPKKKMHTVVSGYSYIHFLIRAIDCASLLLRFTLKLSLAFSPAYRHLGNPAFHPLFPPPSSPPPLPPPPVHLPLPFGSQAPGPCTPLVTRFDHWNGS